MSTPYAGDITPQEAWKLLADDPSAVLVDCRTEAEWRFVGVPDLAELRRDVVYVEWNKSNGSHNDGFLDDLTGAGVTPGERPVIFLCRSGNRSIGAAVAATEAGIARRTTCSTDSRAISTRTATGAQPAGKRSACLGNRRSDRRSDRVHNRARVSS